MQKIFDSELKLMSILWEKEPVSAKELSLIAAATLEWNKNTTYTVIKKLEAKGFIKRTEPNFICSSLVSRFGGSKKALFSALLEDESLTEDELAELKRMIEKR